MDAHPLLVVFHDPPDMMGIPDPVNGKTELHNTWLVSIVYRQTVHPLTVDLKTDLTKSYIDWAVTNEFQVIDVNVPKYVTKREVSLALIII